MASSITHTNDKNFDTHVLTASGPVLVDFWADWCGPCHAIAPTLEELAVDYHGRIEVHKVNVDQNPEVTVRYGIRSLPTLMLFDKGQPVKAFSGVQPKMKLNAALDQLV